MNLKHLRLNEEHILKKIINSNITLFPFFKNIFIKPEKKYILPHNIIGLKHVHALEFFSKLQILLIFE